ncbi:MAG: DNA repair protein RecN, partial [Thermoanaerobaculia bacterium]|nr:DNA repair protein RecN [Thermoanaerobaculia bacterium]
AAGLAAAEGALAGDEGSAVGLVHGARRALSAIGEWEPLAGELERELGEVEIRLSEAARAVSARLGGLEVDPRRLDEVESRLALLERLTRKYGLDAAGLAARRQEIGRELAALAGGEGDREAVAARVAEALAAYRQAATELSQARAAWGGELEARVASELGELALGRARLTVGLERDRRAGSPLVVGGEAVEFGADGFDRVVFGFAPNPGEPALPLVRIASGGELARVALALQLATRGDEVAGGPTLVFDEIDAGLGGAEGAAIGRKLKRLARRGQIVAVTHLAQVASFGDRHYRVRKRERAGRTHAEVEPLDRAGRVEEIARMLSADKITAASRRNADELLAAAAKGRA